MTLLAASLVLSASACVRNSTHERALRKLNDCQGSLGTCERTVTDKDAEIGTLNETVKKTEGELATQKAATEAAETRLSELTANLQSTREDLDVLRKQRESTQKRLEAFRALTERFRALVDTGKLQVSFRNGQMVLKLPAEILFASGKSNLSKEGMVALGEVVAILLEFKDRRFVIAGHTDNVQIKTRQFKNNWDLSTARAVSVVEFMISAGFPPESLAAAGYGEFDAVSPNDTAEGRQLNRRIELILVPDLSELPTLTADPS
jgi:chemotaxis protein MotB